MFEKVNPSHPDKVADRIAGAIVDLAYKKDPNVKVAVEVLIGHGDCTIIIESSEFFEYKEVKEIVQRIAGPYVELSNLINTAQDKLLAANQKGSCKCGDNGIFKGSPMTDEQDILVDLAKRIYEKYPSDGKYLIDKGKITVCQSQAKTEDLKQLCPEAIIINPLGDWIGGLDVDSGATNRKLGSDMGDGVTGGGLHGKDLTKADVTINVYLDLLANVLNIPVYASCSIGDTWFTVYDESGVPIIEVRFEEAMKVAKHFIDTIGGFEKFAEWGLVA